MKRATIVMRSGRRVRMECSVADGKCSDALNLTCVSMAIGGHCPELKLMDEKGAVEPSEVKTAYHIGQVERVISSRKGE
jgi:hypothetical protein